MAENQPDSREHENCYCCGIHITSSQTRSVGNRFLCRSCGDFILPIVNLLADRVMKVYKDELVNYPTDSVFNLQEHIKRRAKDYWATEIE